NLMGVQQVPFSPTYKGSTKRDRREFMDEYLAYSRRIEVLNRGIGGTLILMPLAACIDQKIVPRVCAHDFGKSFEDITENDRRDYFLLLADFYEKLEQLDVAHLPEQEPKQSVKILTAAIRSHQLKATVERQLTRETNKAYKSDRDDAKSKIIVAAVGSKDALIIDCPRTVACDVNGVTALALLDSGADQSVVSPTFLARVEKIGNFTLAVRQLDRPIELGGFMEAMKLTVDREVKLRLTFDTAEGTLVLSNLKCWVAAMPLQDGLVDVIVSRNVMARLGYCPHLLLAQARRAQSVYDLNQLGDKETPLIFCSHEGG
ncbi:hypothetical protein DYB32_010754, partial [Aphanomyces invadans]